MKEQLCHCSPLIARRPARSQAALIVLNEINVSRNPNEDALVMKADQIREMRGRLKRRELKGGKSWGGRKGCT